jgi:multiple sugar transport system permease protein
MAEAATIVRMLFLSLLLAWVLVPIFVAVIYSFAEESEYYSDKPIPTGFTLEHMRLLWALGAGEAIVNSVLVGLGTVALSFALGLPAGYALARYYFPGRDLVKLAIIATRMFPVVVIAVSLLKTFITLRLADTLPGLVLAHTAMALPFVILITSSVFAGVPRELEEAGYIFGLSPLGVFLRITLPLAAPGLAAAAMFTFLLSWNEVFIASALTLTNRTLPAFILTSALATPTDPIKFAAAVLMIIPALIFILLARRYLITMWAMAR